MAQIDTVFNFLINNYNENEPIFLSNLSIPNMKDVSVRQQLKKLTEDGRIKRFDTGIYYIPKKTFFKTFSTLSIDEVIKKKFLLDGDSICGYVCGIRFANRLGLTTQVPMVYEICSNKATTEYRNIKVGNFHVILRKPYVEITNQNVDILQFLDLLREIVSISELEGPELTDRLLGYLKAKNLGFDMLKEYFIYYPDKIYKNMYKVGLLNCVAT
ncbi:MAG: DUF6088 family protein [Lachnospiraceae bacterium]|nr:DUF6088 family protein [Lachnospiraceae bacterium]